MEARSHSVIRDGVRLGFYIVTETCVEAYLPQYPPGPARIGKRFANVEAAVAYIVSGESISDD